MFHYCRRDECGVRFSSKHSKAKYCGRRCSAIAANKGRKTRPGRRKYTDEHLLEIIRNFHKETGEVPSTRLIEPIVNAKTFRNRFGSWANAVCAAGLVPKVRHPSSFEVGNRRQVTFGVRYEVFRRDNFTCQYCGGTPQLGYLLHADHVDPTGPSELSNLITACFYCNIGKSNKV